VPVRACVLSSSESAAAQATARSCISCCWAGVLCHRSRPRNSSMAVWLQSVKTATKFMACCALAERLASRFCCFRSAASSQEIAAIRPAASDIAGAGTARGE